MFDINHLSHLRKCPAIDSVLSKNSIYGFDSPGGTDKQSLHSFGPVYESLLAPSRDKSIVLLEIGIQFGGSMLLWHELLPYSRIIGVDIVDNRHSSVVNSLDSWRSSFLIGDAYSLSLLDSLKVLTPSGIDFMIDDGPHTLESQCFFLRNYLPLLRSSGVAVFEDIQSVSWFRDLRSCVPSSSRLQVVDRRHIKGSYDDLMLIVTAR